MRGYTKLTTLATVLVMILLSACGTQDDTRDGADAQVVSADYNERLDTLYEATEQVYTRSAELREFTNFAHTPRGALQNRETFTQANAEQFAALTRECIDAQNEVDALESELNFPDFDASRNELLSERSDFYERADCHVRMLGVRCVGYTGCPSRLYLRDITYRVDTVYADYIVFYDDVNPLGRQQNGPLFTVLYSQLRNYQRYIGYSLQAVQEDHFLRADGTVHLPSTHLLVQTRTLQQQCEQIVSEYNTAAEGVADVSLIAEQIDQRHTPPPGVDLGELSASSVCMLPFATATGNLRDGQLL